METNDYRRSENEQIQNYAADAERVLSQRVAYEAQLQKEKQDEAAIHATRKDKTSLQG